MLCVALSILRQNVTPNVNELQYRKDQFTLRTAMSSVNGRLLKHNMLRNSRY